MTEKEQDERRKAIWSVNAWVGMNQDLSPRAAGRIFRIAIEEVLPDVTEGEIGYALGLARPRRS